MGLVLGKDAILSVRVASTGDFLPIGCARSVTFDVQNEFIETSGVGSGNYRTYIPSAATVSGTMDGLVLLGGETIDDIYNLGNIYDYLLNSKLNLKFSMLDESAQYYIDKSVDVYIESISETTSFDNVTTFSINFKGTGSITVQYGEI